MIIPLIVGSIKRHKVLMSEYFPEPKSLEKVKVELDLSNYTTKIDFKMQWGLIHHLLLKELI